ncbi:transglutaminase-like domain-containing protein [Amaricoccus solimangrovi]|uniref:Transglutaminase family protein n=1 Tax=Amaricoccus solimangrovi TaxID=2589815 RepID=A0A501WIP2_9RHOB|nr:transglutaminase family protein [Amaricoccus solimangrovi]TPE49753.1 transglutaminase family protein [Amaricoccus solimangrovi]
MIIEIDTRLDYKVAPDSPALLQIEAASLPDQRILETTTDARHASVFVRIPAEDGVGERSWIVAGDRLRCDYRARVEIDRPEVELRALAPTPPRDLPGEVVKYTLGSRFIVPELFEPFVSTRFEGLRGGAFAAAARDWIERELAYVPGASDGTTTAADTFLKRQGICRDYAHLMIAFARAGGIPARMVSVYAPSVEPPDFHAVCELYLAGAWHLVDPTGMAGAGEMVRIGVGRDAADIAFLTVKGESELVKQSVSVRRG